MQNGYQGARKLLEGKKNNSLACLKSFGKAADADWDGKCYCIPGYVQSENRCSPGDDVALTQELVEAW